MEIDSVISHINCHGIVGLNNLGEYFSEKGMLHESVRTLEECLAVQNSFLPPNHPLTVTS